MLVLYGVKKAPCTVHIRRQIRLIHSGVFSSIKWETEIRQRCTRGQRDVYIFTLYSETCKVITALYHSEYHRRRYLVRHLLADSN
ncbi:hypothetical protein FKM82_026274 [Ascaphus truei]